MNFFKKWKEKRRILSLNDERTRAFMNMDETNFINHSSFGTTLISVPHSTDPTKRYYIMTLMAYRTQRYLDEDRITSVINVRNEVIFAPTFFERLKGVTLEIKLLQAREELWGYSRKLKRAVREDFNLQKKYSARVFVRSIEEIEEGYVEQSMQEETDQKEQKPNSGKILKFPSVH